MHIGRRAVRRAAALRAPRRAARGRVRRDVLRQGRVDDAPDGRAAQLAADGAVPGAGRQPEHPVRERRDRPVARFGRIRGAPTGGQMVHRVGPQALRRRGEPLRMARRDGDRRYDCDHRADPCDPAPVPQPADCAVRRCTDGDRRRGDHDEPHRPARYLHHGACARRVQPAADAPRLGQGTARARRRPGRASAADRGLVVPHRRGRAAWLRCSAVY